MNASNIFGDQWNEPPVGPYPAMPPLPETSIDIPSITYYEQPKLVKVIEEYDGDGNLVRKELHYE